jgi:hypothetical protein
MFRDSMTHVALSDHAIPAGRTGPEDGDRLLSSVHPPVFLHCGWRTRGTWIWNQFRGLDGATGYYEPLAERLAELQPGAPMAISAETWPSGHKGLDCPYFEEFRPLLRPRRIGVPGYRTDFATRRFFAAQDATLPAPRAYLRGLLRAAEQRDTQPVLKFCRSLGRIGWMQRNFPDAVHIVVLRDPFAQYASASRQFIANGNGYFLAMPLLLLALHQNQPLVRRCLRHLDVRLPDLTSSRSGLEACEASLLGGDPEHWYRGFLAFWVAVAACLPPDIDLIIDSDALIRDRSYRLRCEIELARLTGRDLDFADADPGDGGRPDAPIARRSEILRAHTAADAFLAEQHGADWADGPVLGHVARLLAEARSLALGAKATPFSGLAASGAWGIDTVAQVRAVRAEQELAAIRASRSWKVTAPMRWLRECLR